MALLWVEFSKVEVFREEWCVVGVFKRVGRYGFGYFFVWIYINN